MHGPFVPFNILFTHAVQYLDTIDLARLDNFAASLRYESHSQEATTHPYRLYELLCKGARLYFDMNTSVSADPTLTKDLPESLNGFDLAQVGVEAVAAANKSSEPFDLQPYALSDWYYGNQHMMSLFEDDLNI